MKKIISIICAAALLIGLTASCSKANGQVKIGVSFGVGSAARWEQEIVYMNEHAKALGVSIETRLNKTDTPKTQEQDCFEMIDSGIDVLILTPRDVNNVKGIIDYAKKKKVKIISYARIVLNHDFDLFVGYDSGKMGQSIGQYLSEMVIKGDYIILRGDDGDTNAKLLYDGSMRFISEIEDDINIILDEPVKGWDPALAKKMVIDAIKKNSNKVDAILAPNDKLAGACAEAIEELKLTNHVVITGMDAELEAVKRVVKGKQDITLYIDLKDLAYLAIDEAVNLATGKKLNANSNFDNGTPEGVKANLVTGRLVTKENVDKILIESGYYTKSEVYE